MSLKQPAGRILVNTGVGNCDKINPADINEYRFVGDNRVHRYMVDGKPIAINRYKKAIEELSMTKF